MFQIVSGGPTYIAEYIITEANCTETCSPLLDASAVSIKEILTNRFFPRANFENADKPGRVFLRLAASVMLKGKKGLTKWTARCSQFR